MQSDTDDCIDIEKYAARYRDSHRKMQVERYNQVQRGTYYFVMNIRVHGDIQPSTDMCSEIYT